MKNQGGEKQSLLLALTESFLENISDGVFTVDRNGLVTSFNRAAEEITGVSRREALNQRGSEVFRCSMCGTDCASNDFRGNLLSRVCLASIESDLISFGIWSKKFIRHFSQILSRLQQIFVKSAGYVLQLKKTEIDRSEHLHSSSFEMQKKSALCICLLDTYPLIGVPHFLLLKHAS